jgi:hypothetical protein
MALTNENSASDETFDPTAEAKRLLRCSRAAALATLAKPEGFPFASLVNVATAPDGSPILLLSRLAGHTRHLDADPRMSLLFYLALNQPTEGDPLAHSRLTILGRAERVKDDTETSLRARFLARHPESSIYADFVDFGFFHVTVESAYLNGGFARAANLSAETLLTSLKDAEDLVADEASVLKEIAEEKANLARDLASAYGGASDKSWRVLGFDPEGLDIGDEERIIRVPFAERVTTEKELWAEIAALRPKTPSTENPS